MILGRSLETLKTAARRKAVEHYAAQQEEARPAALAVTDALKLAEAKIVLAGGVSLYIAAEAKLKGLTPLALARQVKEASEASALALELKRQEMNVRIDRCGCHADVRKLLDEAGIAWPA